MVGGILLSAREVAGRLAVHDSTVRRMLLGGEFPNAFKAGNVWKIPEPDVENYVEKQRRERQAAASTVES